MLSVTLPNTPEVVASVMVAPPVVKLFPLTSFSCTVMVEILVPLAVIDEGEALISEVVVLAAPGVKVTVSLSVIEAPLILPVMVAVPAVVDEVNVAV